MDIDRILQAFPYEPGRLNARVVVAENGREVLLVRLELGVLQMECDGRPDGRSGGRAAAVPWEAAGATAANLTAEQAALWRLELVQFQQRSHAFLAVGDPARALRDAEVVVRGAAALEQAAPEVEGDWASGARFSALVLRTRAAGLMLSSAGRLREAAAVIESGLELLRAAAERAGLGSHFERLGDVIALRAWKDSLVPMLPPAQRGELEERLRAAVRAENYELAAILRDELRLL